MKTMIYKWNTGFSKMKVSETKFYTQNRDPKKWRTHKVGEGEGNPNPILDER